MINGTIFPEYINKQKFDSSNNLYEGDILITIPEFDEFLDVDCILRFDNGKLNDKYAVETMTGYFEEWINGEYILSRSIRKRKTKIFTQDEKNIHRIEKIKNCFQNIDFSTINQQKTSLSKYLTLEDEQIIDESLIDPMVLKIR